MSTLTEILLRRKWNGILYGKEEISLVCPKQSITKLYNAFVVALVIFLNEEIAQIHRAFVSTK